jgi:hypothetical protein
LPINRLWGGFDVALGGFASIDAGRSRLDDFAGLSLRGEICDFIATVEQLDPSEPLYWQRV